MYSANSLNNLALYLYILFVDSICHTQKKKKSAFGIFKQPNTFTWADDNTALNKQPLHWLIASPNV